MYCQVPINIRKRKPPTKILKENYVNYVENFRLEGKTSEVYRAIMEARASVCP